MIVVSSSSIGLSNIGPLLALGNGQWVSFEPERASTGHCINCGVRPPRHLIAATMNLAMVASAQRDREFVTDLSSESAALGEAEVVSV